MAARKKTTVPKVDKETQKEAMLSIPGIQALDEAHGTKWTLYHADCIDVLRQLPDNCLDYAIYSPPFASLYVYSESERDMGNTSSDDEFLDQYRYMAEELTRCLRPGRLITVHCKELSNFMHMKGHGGVRDFPGELTRIHEQSGMVYHGRRTIWKDPVAEMQRTKAHRLLYKELRKDSTVSGNGMPDYLLHFRKWPKDREDPEIQRVEHTHESFPLDDWQKYASPVWMDIDQSDTLNVRMAKEADDERHMCLASGSLVLTREGYFPIQDVEVGDQVLTHRGRWRTVTAKRRTGQRRVVTLTANGVPGISVTPDHRVWTRKASPSHPRRSAMASLPEWVQAKDTLSSYVNLPLPPVEESNYSEQEWWIVGRWLADGSWSTRGHLCISCGKHKLDKLLANLGDRAGHVGNTVSAYSVAILDRSGRLRSLIKKFGRGALGKNIPAEALCLDSVKAKALLDGYLSGDGHYVAKYDRWTATSISRPLLLGMAMVAQRALGVSCSVYAGKKGGTATICGRNVNTRDEWILSIPPRNVSAFMSHDGAWKKVRRVSKESESEVEVWDLQIEEDESFVAEGCVVHNCPLQLGVIRRCLKLHTNPGDVVFSPFAGIGSEGYVSVQEGRRFIGTELKRAYWEHACRYLKDAEPKQISLFEELT